MPRKTIVLIVTLFLITIVLLAVAMQSNKPKQQVTQQQPEITQKPSLSSYVMTTLQLSPNPIYLESGNGSADIQINTNTNEVTAVQLEIKYDPKVLSNVKVVSGEFFTQPIQLINTTDKKAGHVTYAFGITPAQQPVKGTGVVAKITFTKIPGTLAKETSLMLLPPNDQNTGSLVSASGIDGNVLKATDSTTVILQ